MNKFELHDDEWFWCPEPDIRLRVGCGPNNTHISEIMNQPRFVEFLGEDYKLFTKYKFKLWWAESDDDEFYVYGENTMIKSLAATITINMVTGIKTTNIESNNGIDSIRFDAFKERYKEYFDTCENIDAMQAEIIAARERARLLAAENATLRAENLEMRYRPGGPGYNEAAEHFATLAVE